MKLYDVIRKEDMERGTPLKEIPLSPKFKRQKKSRHAHPRALLWKKIVIAAAVILAVIALYILGMVFVHAKVVITQHTVPFTLDNATFTVVPQTTGGTAPLTFQTMTVPDQVSREVYGSSLSHVTTAATGKVVFFNNYSTSEQTLRTKTKLTATNGKTYEITQEVKIPGYTVSGGAKTPGTSAATPIVALGAGPAYNSDGTSFTIAAWAGTSKAKQLYAQSSGSISGGEDGTVYSVGSDQKDNITATLQSDLVERLKRDTRAQVPDSLVAFPNLEVTSINDNSLTLSGDAVKFPASLQGTMIAYLIPRDQLETAVGDYVLNDHPYARVSIPVLTSLTVTPVAPLPTDPTNTPSSLTVTISGQGTLIAQAPLDTLRQSLIGISKRKFAMLLSTIPEIDTARYHLYPFWAPFFPSKVSRITLQTNN